MNQPPFSDWRRAVVRDRAAAIGPDLFLLERAFDDILERVAMIDRPMDSLLLIGCPATEWLDRLRQSIASIQVIEPGRRFAAQAGTDAELEVSANLGEHDLAIAIGTLDTVNDLPRALTRIAEALRPGGQLFGAIAGGNSLPALRAALIEGERPDGVIAQRVHPRIDGPTLVGLLDRAGFERSVVDVDRITLRYASMAALVGDLRAMGATSQLARIAPLSRAAAARAAAAFDAAAVDGKTPEIVEILYFTGTRKTTR